MRNPFAKGSPKGPRTLLGFVAAALLLSLGCGTEPDIVQYTVDTRMPDVLKNDTRLLGAIVPNESDVWFFKLTGENESVDQVASELRQWVIDVQFEQGAPILNLPEGWIEKPASAMRFTTIEIPVGDPPLEISVSKLSMSDDWSELVAANVNRWRDQMGLEPSDAKWAGAELLSQQDSDTPAIWVDLTGQLGGGTSMSAQPPFAGGQPPLAAGQPPANSPPPSSKPPIEFDEPESWRQGKTSSMRWAAFIVGPEDKSAEITVIPAGGDLRGNIQRWMGQIQPDGVTEEQVDTVISKASPVTVDGIESQRFYMTGTGEPQQAIDATIVPLGEGFSLFIKMTGDAETVAAESERIQQFLDSLKLNS